MTEEPQNDDIRMTEKAVSSMDTRNTSPCLPSTPVPSWTSPSDKWDLFGEAIFSPSCQQKKNQKSMIVSSSQ